jgi:hypothetical protein
MRWDDTYQGSHECYAWYDLLAGEGTDKDDLLAGEGTDKDELLGYVRENITNGEFIAQINDRTQMSKKFNNLEDAKAHIVTYYVTQKLEGE